MPDDTPIAAEDHLLGETGPARLSIMNAQSIPNMAHEHGKRRELMKTMSLDDRLYSALEAASSQSGRSIQELVNEAIQSWLAEAAMDDAEYAAIEYVRAEAGEPGGVESDHLRSL